MVQVSEWNLDPTPLEMQLPVIVTMSESASVRLRMTWEQFMQN